MAPPETPEKELPRTVSKVRQQLLEKGFSIDRKLSGAELHQAIDGKQLNVLASGFRQGMQGKVKEDYKGLTTEDRRNWLAQYLLDPFTGVSHGFSSTTASDSRYNKAKGSWVTQAQLSGPDWLNSEEHAKTLVEGGNLKSRPHEEPLLAAHGVLQYEYFKTCITKSTGWEKRSGTETRSELKPEEQQQVANHIEASFQEEKPKKKARTEEPKKKEETELEKTTRLVRTKRQAILRKFKFGIDKAFADIASFLADCDKVKAKRRNHGSTLGAGVGLVSVLGSVWVSVSVRFRFRFVSCSFWF